MVRESNVERKNITERELRPMSGLGMLILGILGIIICIVLLIMGGFLMDSGGVLPVVMLGVGIIGCVLIPFVFCGLKIVNPNEALVLTLFGKYHGTIKKDGFTLSTPLPQPLIPQQEWLRSRLKASTSWRTRRKA